MNAAPRTWQRFALWAAGLLIALWVLGRFHTLVLFTVAVGIITFPIFPAVDWLERRGRASRGAAAGLTLLGLTVVVGVVIAVAVPWMIHQGQVLIGIAPRGIAAVADVLSRWQVRVSDPAFPQLLRTAWERGGESVIGAANAAATRAVNLAVGWFGQIYLLFLIPFVVYFVLVDYRETRTSLISLLPEGSRMRTEMLLTKLSTTLRWGLWAQVVVSSIVGALTAAGLAIAGVPGPLAIGLFAAFAEAIPYVGGFATYGVALLAAVPLGGTVWIWAVVVVTFVKLLSNLIVPLVLGRMTHNHPLAIIAALLVLGQMFGVLGMFFAVPAVVVAREVLAWWRSTTAS